MARVIANGRVAGAVAGLATIRRLETDLLPYLTEKFVKGSPEEKLIALNRDPDAAINIITEKSNIVDAALELDLCPRDLKAWIASYAPDTPRLQLSGNEIIADGQKIPVLSVEHVIVLQQMTNMTIATLVGTDEISIAILRKESVLRYPLYRAAEGDESKSASAEQGQDAKIHDANPRLQERAASARRPSTPAPEAESAQVLLISTARVESTPAEASTSSKQTTALEKDIVLFEQAYGAAKRLAASTTSADRRKSITGLKLAEQAAKRIANTYTDNWRELCAWRSRATEVRNLMQMTMYEFPVQ